MDILLRSFAHKSITQQKAVLVGIQRIKSLKSIAGICFKEMGADFIVWQVFKLLLNIRILCKIPTSLEVQTVLPKSLNYL